jgi:DNA-binding SARP family transcriptional activator
MTLLRISLFGGVQLSHEGLATSVAPTRAVQILLAYLLLHRRRLHSRESLVGTFWGEHDEESARNCLNTTLWRLRRVLEPSGVARGTYLVTTSAGEIGFNDQSPHWLDVEVLERCAGAVSTAADATLKDSDVAELEVALRLYTGDILDGVFDDWALRERERLRGLYLSGRACLLRYHANHGAPERAIAHAEEILRHDPLREEIHRELMRLQVAAGARAMAARQYDVCKRALAAELGVDPMPETQALLAAIKRGAATGGAAASTSTEVNALTRELRGAAQSVERALSYLRDVVGRVEQTLESAARR